MDEKEITKFALELFVSYAQDHAYTSAGPSEAEAWNNDAIRAIIMLNELENENDNT